MGKYINKIGDKEAPRIFKVKFILQNVVGANVIYPPAEWQEDLVCVVHNFAFDAAGYADTPEEMRVFLEPDGRRKTWMLVPNAKDYAK